MNDFVVLIIRDGWGVGPAGKYNAVSSANTPNMDAYFKNYPRTLLKASGEAVGLPEGYQGSSEVGHLNIGAGRIVIQELKRIKDLIENGELFKSRPFKNAIDNCLENKSALHLLGLVQDEGVHAHIDHLFSVMEYAKKRGIKNIYIHFFADGRDTPPRSAMQYVKAVEEKIRELGIGRIATISGRYYAMDRSENWEITDMAFDAMVNAKGDIAETAASAVSAAYSTGKNPDGSPMVDEYIPPSVIGDYKGVKDGDSVIHTNFRQDRAIQLTKAFVEDDYPGNRAKKPNVAFCGFTRYYDSFKLNALSPLDEDKSMSNLLGEVLGKNGLKQLRISETQKFKHVTSFFNGKLLKPYPGEDRVEIKGTFDVASFAQNPQMNAPEVTSAVVEKTKEGKYKFILVNFANCDMVGHTGNFDSVVKAVEMVDTCVGQIVDVTLKTGGSLIVTSDHGNAEDMWNEKLEMSKTSHTNNLVDLYYISKDGKNVSLRENGILADIAPTILSVLKIKQPAEMTGKSLIL
jgi:2,3-bisphosphoglycerate-independent phosphoglycerate mutase